MVRLVEQRFGGVSILQAASDHQRRSGAKPRVRAAHQWGDQRDQTRTGGSGFEQIEKAFGNFAIQVGTATAVPSGKHSRQPNVEPRFDQGDLVGERDGQIPGEKGGLQTSSIRRPFWTSSVMRYCRPGASRSL